VTKFQQRIKLPAIVAIGSLILILLLTLLTSPLKSIIAVAVFFILLTTFFISFGFAFLEAQGTNSATARKRTLLFCSVLVLLLMLRSAKALSLLDACLMLLFFGGLTFYISRR
jgi:hypothetical protein